MNKWVNERMREWRKKPENMAKTREGIYRWMRENPEKHRAHSLVSYHVRKGNIVKSKFCEECGTTGRLEGHHDDYSKPLTVRWLCRKCHVALASLVTALSD